MVDAGNVTALTDAGGREVLPAGQYEMIFPVREDELYAAGSEGHFDLFDAAGDFVAGSFSMLADMNGALVYRRGGQYGAMDGSGAALIDPEWTQLTAASPERFLALNTSPLDEQPDLVYALVPGEAPRSTGIYVDGGLQPFADGRMIFRAPDGRYGCLDGEGRAVVPAGWSWIGQYEGGAAAVSDGAMVGLLDTDGGIRLPLRYTWLHRGEDLLIALGEDGEMELWTPDGTMPLGTVADAWEVAPAGPFAAVRRPDATTLYNASGEAVCTASPDALFFPGLDGQVILSDGPWGTACQMLLDPDGQPVSGPYMRILPLVSGRYAALTFNEDYSDMQCALIDGQGNALLSEPAREILPAGEDRLVLVTEGEVILADLDGNAVKRWKED